jgi:glycosyltransferase involved in cell wall biosynthesis
VLCLPPPLRENPYQRLLYQHLNDHGCELVSDPRLHAGVLRFRWLWRWRAEVDYLHFHWPQGLYRHNRGPARLRGPLSWVKLGALAPRLAVARLLGYRLTWTIHQVTPHDARDRMLDRLAARLLARCAHVLIAHDEDTLADIRARLPAHAPRVHVIPLGSYADSYPAGRPRAATRRELGIPSDAFVFLCFGTVRAYKQLSALLKAFRAARLPDAVLVVAGPALDEHEGDTVRTAAAADARIKPLLRFVPDDRVRELYGASDVAVLPRSGGTSGALVLALSLGVPVVAARTSAYTTLTGGERAGWLFDPGDPDSLRAALERAASDPAPRRKGRAALEQAEHLSWPSVAAATARALRGEREADDSVAVERAAVAA